MIYKVFNIKKYYLFKDENNNSYKILKKIFDQYETGYKKGEEILNLDEDFFNEILKESMFLDGYEISLKSIMKRRKTQNQVYENLIIKGYDKEIISEIIEKLKSEGYIDDLSFIEDFIEYQKNEKLLSRIALKRKLFYRFGKKFGDENDINFSIEGIFERIYPQEDEIDIAFKLLHKYNKLEKIKKLKNDKKEKYYEIEENNFDSLINEEILNIKKFLSSKGFSYNTIYSILKLIKI